MKSFVICTKTTLVIESRRENERVFVGKPKRKRPLERRRR